MKGNADFINMGKILKRLLVVFVVLFIVASMIVGGLYTCKYRNELAEFLNIGESDEVHLPPECNSVISAGDDGLARMVITIQDRNHESLLVNPTTGQFYTGEDLNRFFAGQ